MWGSIVSGPPAKTGGLKYKARGTQYEIRDATVLTRPWLISGYQVGYRPLAPALGYYRSLIGWSESNHFTALKKPASALTRTELQRYAKMIEVVAIVLGVFCVAIFVAHAVDAYLAPL
jgi:hypothetical protein